LRFTQTETGVGALKYPDKLLGNTIDHYSSKRKQRDFCMVISTIYTSRNAYKCRFQDEIQSFFAMGESKQHVKLLPKKIWKDAIGASNTPKRLHLEPDDDGLFHCPISYCDSSSYRSQRGCRKHVFTKHGWYFYFDTKPNIEAVIPGYRKNNLKLTKTRRSRTSAVPMFLKSCTFYINFKKWLESACGGGKGHSQADQIATKVLKYLKFCCPDDSSDWDVPFQVVDYFVASITCISNFIDYLKDNWSVGKAGIIGYLNSLSHFIDYRRIEKKDGQNSEVFITCEVYISRVKKTVSKQMRVEWNSLLSVEHLTKINCWATLEDLERVIPYHTDRFSQIMTNAASTAEGQVPSHDLSFCTSYMVIVLFLLVKATRPMSYQYLTVSMVKSLEKTGIIDQTFFKTQERYGFDTLLFSKEVIDIVKGYCYVIRPRLSPCCEYLLISRNGTQLASLSDIFGRTVFQAIGKYINPTRYRQIIETESADKLTIDEQAAITEDQKHTSFVAKIHYKKRNSRQIAERRKLRDQSESVNAIKSASTFIHFDVETSKETTENDVDYDDQETQSNSAPTSTKDLARKKKVPFSKLEDDCLRSGLKKHGNGKWTNILKDGQYKFHPSRKSSTLLTRAKLCKLI